MKNEKYTWRELKEFANSLNDEQLDCPVVAWSEDVAHRISEAFQLEEDYLAHKDGFAEGCFPKSQLEDVMEEGETESDYDTVLKQGTPILTIPF